MEIMSVIAGPCGGTGGEAWDDGSHDGIREITMSYGGCIDSIKVVYGGEENPFVANKHGGPGGSRKTEIKLNYPEEYLMSIHGHYSRAQFIGDPVTLIRSLTLKSNLRTFGPFGTETGAPFSLVAEGAQMVGLFGRSGRYLDAIGFRVSSIRPKNF